jgi:CheY-like chemotaxis protein/DNA-directed RNA polymerase specialized sigma24 family protein
MRTENPTPQEPLVQRIAPHLPFLRRYARALTGAQQPGDDLVGAVLERIVKDVGVLKGGPADMKVALYRLLHRVIASDADGAEAPGTSGNMLSALPLGAREALLLTTVEGFSNQQAGTILGCTAVDVAASADVARDAIGRMMVSRVLIIEDEPIIAMHLAAIVGELGHQIVATAASRDAAVKAAAETQPELVLADINLADGSSGIDAVYDILKLGEVPVLFITAYPERLLTGTRPEPTYLITKPFEPATVIATIGQALLLHRHPKASGA